MENTLKHFILSYWIMTIILLMGFCLPANAHFGMIIPSDAMVLQNDVRTITVTLSFSHPFEMQGMPLVKPSAFDVVVNGKQNNLISQLKQTKVMGYSAWTLSYPVKRPGVYIFSMTPQPYWEPAEDCYIVHFTKTVVTAFGVDDGWDAEIGLKTEIVPLSKPFGLYAGNLFQGIVKKDGKPVPFAEVEVEYFNKDKKSQAPTDYMITQTIKADPNGVFSYATPKSGWWGFAALSTADYQIPHEGVQKDVEIGAVIWVEVLDWQAK